MPDSQLAFTSVAYTVTFGSLLIALAQESWQFFAARAVQGVGAALVSPNALALVLSRFDDTAQRNVAMGIWSAVGAGGAVAGQLLGGLVVELWGWRWIFLLNVPVGLAATALALVLLRESSTRAGSLDITGSALLCAGLVPAVLSFAWLPHQGLSPAQPLVGLALVRAPGVAIGILALAVSAAAVTASLFFTTLYMQSVLGHSALAVGLAFAPITVLIMTVAPRAATQVTTLGARPAR